MGRASNLLWRQVVNFESVLLVNNLPGSHAFADSLHFLGQERNAGKTLQVRERLVQEGGRPCLPVGSIASFLVPVSSSNLLHGRTETIREFLP
jgi:hypothetical protein